MHLYDKINHANAMANAIQRQEEFYTLQVDGTTKHIMLPSPQRCGTSVQQRTYAMGKAMDILEQNINKQ